MALNTLSWAASLLSLALIVCGLHVYLGGARVGRAADGTAGGDVTCGSLTTSLTWSCEGVPGRCDSSRPECMEILRKSGKFIRLTQRPDGPGLQTPCKDCLRVNPKPQALFIAGFLPVAASWAGLGMAASGAMALSAVLRYRAAGIASEARNISTELQVPMSA
mmetsp:Transcript_124687/g.349210  ORF Transcript_124687/g.349210 Transcript_124687/m.349210 type:complete len:163 (+) Transcript_124687:77-565(+)|eukprot:CAMPEP_0176241188 /NCGR_PEP_ID=MMETSP0121_2-20121125/29762_1 /TAXON_ID=160619 /ORGANISM="Kryptoperidinium foliaceum, Strain CCMP 1326" /LENGTH=162 /DNA_ID=CAMNT_0017580707 /DNA_START=65 /DNA_END=553 /DNA_ORIENTATION=+